MHLRWSPLCEATYLYQYSSWVVSGGKPNYRRSMEAGREAVLTAQDYFMVVGVAAAASSATRERLGMCCRNNAQMANERDRGAALQLSGSR